jgi:hypothetical protein
MALAPSRRWKEKNFAMPKSSPTLFTILSLTLLGNLGLGACQRHESPAEKAADRVEDATDKAGAKLEDAGDKIKNKAHDATH